MNLKEAFRYQNKLQSFLDEAQGILDRDSNVTRVENTYLRHKVMAEAEDETVLAMPETEYYEGITDIARFLLYLLDEKGKLFAAIRKAKTELDIDMDSAVSLNATRQSIARTFKRMNDAYQGRDQGMERCFLLRILLRRSYPRHRGNQILPEQ